MFNCVLDVEFKCLIDKALGSNNEDELLIQAQESISNILKDEEAEIIKFCNQIFYNLQSKDKMNSISKNQIGNKNNS